MKNAAAKTVSLTKKVKSDAAAAAARVSLAAVAVSMAMCSPAYADAIGDQVKSNLTSIVEKGLGGFAAVLGISALITGVMAVKDMAEGSQSSNPDQQNKGQKTLMAAVGVAIAAALLLGIRSTITELLTTAMS